MPPPVFECSDDRSPQRLRDLARTAVDAVGLCKVALMPANARFGTELRALGIQLVDPDERPDAVIATIDLPDRGHLEAVATALTAQPCATCLVLVRQTGPAPGAPSLRVAVEQCFLTAGFFKHPAGTRRFGYEGLGDDASEIWALFEPPLRSPSAMAASLAAERDLHADMLREAGERSDAHVVRYELAARHVRPFDTVLDAACGLGYGAHVLQTLAPAHGITGIDASETAIRYATDCYGNDALAFHCGYLPDALDAHATASIDFVVSLETLEHVEDPERLLSAFARVLKPGGRIFVSVPNDWADESGEDPNPHHLHVYDWDKLQAQLRRHFIVERAWRLIASGCKTGTPRQWRPHARLLEELAPDDAGHQDAEWWLVLAMKSPLEADGAHYVQQVHGQFHGATHLVDFEAHYTNPWLVAAMVELPWRLHDKPALSALAGRVQESAMPDSADYGAALAVEGYRLLEARADADRTTPWLAKASAYAAQASAANPHVARWKISLDFLRARLLEQSGQDALAMQTYARVLNAKPDAITPTLGTKQVEAAWRLGRMAWVGGDTPSARAAWTHGVRAGAQRLGVDWTEFVGDWAAPFPSALNDASEILDGAVRCALALRATAAPHRPRARVAHDLADIERQSLRAAFNRTNQELASARQRLLRLDAEQANQTRGATGHAARLDQLLDEVAQLRAAHTSVEALAHARQREIDALRQQLDRTHAALESTQALAIDRYAAIQAHDAQMQQLRAGHDAATEALRARIIDPQMLQQLRSTLDDAQAALAALNRRHETVVHSWSWRLTHPFRALARLLHLDRDDR